MSWPPRLNGGTSWSPGVRSLAVACAVLSALGASPLGTARLYSLSARIGADHKQMAALEFGERAPVPIKQTRKDFRFHLALLQFFVALLVARVVFAIRINRRHEYDVLAVG